MLKHIILSAAVLTWLVLNVTAQTAKFLPKHLAVLRAGDGVLDLGLKQSPIFIDQYAPGVFNNAPSCTIRIPTNGPNTLFFNGHAATEGILTLSADHRLLAFAGYGGTDLLATQGTPSLLDFKRGFCTVDVAGQTQTLFYRQHGEEDEKMNPRGVVTDGANNFWGCGNALGTVYCNPTGALGTVTFQEIPTTRSINLIHHTLYTTLNNADATACDLPAGIFSFVNKAGVPVALPQAADTTLQPVVRAQAPYTKIAGFDMNPEGTIAYTADVAAGVQKYVKTGDLWKFAYNIVIPQNIAPDDNHANGCFDLVVDFAGKVPVIYATTTEGYNGCVNSNRVVQIVDTGATAAVTTVAQAPSGQTAFRGIAFTPGTP